MLLRLLLIITIIPLVELYVLIEVGRLIGTLPTILLVVFTGFFGIMLARSQGLQIVYRMQRELSFGMIPGDEILDGVCILVGGAMLLTPGLITDILGFALLIPFTRALFKDVAIRLIKAYLLKGSIHVFRR